jgi:hypothetical protein
VRRGADCEAYVPGDPVEGEGVTIPTGVTWQWQLTGIVDTSYDVDVYDVDLFDLSSDLQRELAGDGRIVVCYFSAGSYEPWRPDAGDFPEESIGRALEGWPDERWVDHTDPAVRQIMLERLDLAVDKGCHAVEPDNVTAHDARSGFSLNATEQLDYNRFLADEAHERGLAIALKNDVEQVEDLVDWFDFQVNEECAFYDECFTLAPFVAQNKAVLHAEYVDRWSDAPALAEEVCGVEPGLSTLIKEWDLGPEYLDCSGVD